MTFAFPIWLAALVPWASVAIYLLLGKRPRADVPFINLWRGPVQAPRVRRSLYRVPMWILLLLAAAAMAIVSAAGPQWCEQSAGPLAASRAEKSFGIESLAVAHNQAMVRVLNQSTMLQTNLSIERNGQNTSQRIDLPPPGQSRNYFFDLPADTVSVRATLTDADAAQAGRSVQVTRHRSWPAVNALSPLPEELQRMTDVYAVHRPASEASSRIGIATGDVNRLAGGPGVVVADASEKPMSGTVSVTLHPILNGVEWPKDAKFATPPSPQDWTAIVSEGGRMVVGVREHPARQVWIGFDSPTFAHTAEYVIFWTNVFDWAGQGGDEFQAVQGTVLVSNITVPVVQSPDVVQELAPWFACIAGVLSVFAFAMVRKG